MEFYDQLKFDANGLIPAIVQDQKSGRVLMMAWMNRASLEKTIETGRTHFWSRSRQKFWMKGETSGHVQQVRDLAFDCDGDVLLIQVEQTGAACHEGYRSCFFRSLEKTIETGRTHFWSRSRQKFWMKGETSGHVQQVRDIAFDCDGDVLLIQVEQTGAACHEGYRSCFFRSVEKNGKSVKITEAQLETPEQIYGKK